MFPAGVGHCSQKYAVPSARRPFAERAELPGSRLPTAWSIARAAGPAASPGDQGKRPSAQFVAALRPKLRSSADNALAPQVEVVQPQQRPAVAEQRSVDRGRSLGREAGLRSASIIIETSSSPFICSVLRFPFGAMTFPSDRTRLEPVRELDEFAGEVRRGAAADAARTEARQRARHLAQDVAVEGIREDGLRRRSRARSGRRASDARARRRARASSRRTRRRARSSPTPSATRTDSMSSAWSRVA